LKFPKVAGNLDPVIAWACRARPGAEIMKLTGISWSWIDLGS
jgi:hypothetical protein